MNVEQLEAIKRFYNAYTISNMTLPNQTESNLYHEYWDSNLKWYETNVEAQDWMIEDPLQKITK